MLRKTVIPALAIAMLAFASNPLRAESAPPPPADLAPTEATPETTTPAAPTIANPSDPITARSLTAAADEDIAIWRRNWKSIASRYAITDTGQHHYSLTWDSRYANTRHMPAERWLELNTRTERRISGNLAQNVRIVPPREEALAATGILPALTVGQYGHFHSAQVVEVLGPEEMIVTDVWLVEPTAVAAAKLADQRAADSLLKQQAERVRQADEAARRMAANRIVRAEVDVRAGLVTKDELARQIESRYVEREKLIAIQNASKKSELRLVGFSTLEAMPGMRWTPRGSGQIVIVDDPAARAASKAAATTARLTAVNADLFRASLTESQFIEMLQARGLTLEHFASITRELMRRIRGDATVAIVHSLERARLDYEARAAAAPAAKPARTVKGAAAAADPAAPAPAPATAAAPPARPQAGDWFSGKYTKPETDAPKAQPEADPDRPIRSAGWFRDKYLPKEEP